MKSLVISSLVLAAVSSVAAADRVQLTMDASEAEAVLAILSTRAAGQAVADPAWQKLLACEPYARLKKRENSLRRDFGDDEFKRFVLSEDLLRGAPELQRTLDAWKATDLRAVAERILPYLPPDARVRAKVYPVIKPLSNSFVFEVTSDPAIFLYLDPKQSPEDFATTVAHESHHIGYADASKRYDERIKALSDNPRKAAEWMGAFGEGLAVLAAAGSADVHPMRDFKEADRVRWDQDISFFDQNLAQMNQFFLDVVNGGFAKPEAADHVAFTFFGYRGPWYTVGYQMGAMVEKRYGRAVLVECMSDPRTLLARYNEAAAEQKAAGQKTLPLWSPELLAAVGIAPGIGVALILAAPAARAQEVTIVTDVLGPEGPLFVDGDLYYVAWTSSTLSKWDGRAATVLNALPGCSHNGLALTRQKTFLVACSDEHGAILELDMAGRQLRRWDADDKGQAFAGGVNDVVVTASGGAYATVFGPYQGVPTAVVGKILYLAPGSPKWVEVANDLNYANGIGVSPDQKTLYVSETVGNCILKFRVDDDGSLSHRANFALLNLLTPNKSDSWWLGPDSMKIDAKGDLYVAQWFGGKILKISPEGKLLHVFLIAAGDGTTNLAFGPGEKELYVTVVKDPNDPQAKGSIVRIPNIE